MAAEILDIEAKLDTSQVQGQLQQLSKTSGLQGLDRAVKTLEASMKKLSASAQQLSQRLQQAQVSQPGGGASGGDGNLLGKGGLLVGRQQFVRSAGLYWAGKTVGSQADMLESRYGWKAGAVANMAGGALKGAAFGPLGMLAGGLTALTDSVSEHFRKLAEVSERLIEAKMKEWEATDKAFAVIGEEVKDMRMRAMSAAMSPEQRQKKIDELQTARSEAVSKMVENYDTADKLEGPMYDAAVAAAQYWRDAVKDIDKNLAVLQGDNDKYVKGLEKAAREAAKAAKEEERLADQRAKLRSGYAGNLDDFQFQREMESLRESEGGQGTEYLKAQRAEAQDKLLDAQDKYQALLEEASKSDAPEEFVDRVNDAAKAVQRLEAIQELYADKLEERVAAMSSVLTTAKGSLGNLNSLEQAGYFGMAGQDKTMESLVDQILRFVRQITANTENGQQGDDTQFGNI